MLEEQSGTGTDVEVMNLHLERAAYALCLRLDDSKTWIHDPSAVR